MGATIGLTQLGVKSALAQVWTLTLDCHYNSCLEDENEGGGWVC